MHWWDVQLLVRSTMAHRMGCLGLQKVICGGWLEVRNGAGGRRQRRRRSWNRLEGGSKKGRSHESPPSLMLRIWHHDLGCVPV